VFDAHSDHSGSVLRKRWTDLDQRSRRLLLLGGVVEAILKTAALVTASPETPNSPRVPVLTGLSGLRR
jgi:hypothetical protein